MATVVLGDQRLWQLYNLLDGREAAADVEEAEFLRISKAQHTVGRYLPDPPSEGWGRWDAPEPSVRNNPSTRLFHFYQHSPIFLTLSLIGKEGNKCGAVSASQSGKTFCSKSKEGCPAGLGPACWGVWPGTSLTRFSLVSRVISCCRLASMRASGGSCRFWASSCCCRLFSSFRLWISPRRASASFSWLLFCDCSWDSRSLRRSHTSRKGRWHQSPCLKGTRLHAHLQGQKSRDSVVTV